MSIEVKGLVELQAKMDQMIADMHGPEILDAMRKAALIVTGEAKREAPVDTGRLRSSIAPEVYLQGTTVYGVVGTNVVYAPDVELGTGPRSVSGADLQPWARRKGLNAYAVAAKIRRVGQNRNPFMQRAYDNQLGEIKRVFEDAVATVVNK